jgi:hypothetical protein
MYREYATIYQQYRQCTYNVIFRCFGEIIFVVKKKKTLKIFCVCVCVYVRLSGCERLCACFYVCGRTGASVCLRTCSLTNSACNEPPYRHLQPLWLHHRFRRYFMKGTFFRKTFSDIKCVSWFYLQLLIKPFLFSKRIQVKCPWIFSTYFQKNLKYQVPSTSVQWEPSYSMRRTDRQTGERMDGWTWQSK